MMRIIIRTLLCALAFTSVLPHIAGVDFHGNFLAAVLVSIAFSILLGLVELVVAALSAVWTISTLGIALLWLIPLWIFGFWILPALTLELLASFMPSTLAIHSWGGAVMSGLVMLGVFLLTSETLWGKNPKTA